jgi:hypothetical protein
MKDDIVTWETELPPDWESKTEAQKKAWDDEQFGKWKTQWEGPRRKRDHRHVGFPWDFGLKCMPACPAPMRGRSPCTSIIAHVCVKRASSNWSRPI